MKNLNRDPKKQSKGGTSKMIYKDRTFNNEKFIIEYVKTGNAQASYARAYNKTIKAGTAASNASVLLKKPAIKKRVLEELAKQELTGDFVVNSLRYQIMSGLGIKADAKSANQALKMLIDILNLTNTDTKEQKTRNTYNLTLNQDLRNLSTVEIEQRRKIARETFEKILGNSKSDSNEITK